MLVLWLLHVQNWRVIGQMITGGGNGVEWSFIFVTVCCYSWLYSPSGYYKVYCFCRSQSGSLNNAMVELKLKTLYCVPFDQVVNPRNLACCVWGIWVQIRKVVIAARNRYMLINWMVITWSHDLHNWINHMVLHIGITLYSLTVCLHIFGL